MQKKSFMAYKWTSKHNIIIKIYIKHSTLINAYYFNTKIPKSCNKMIQND